MARWQYLKNFFHHYLGTTKHKAWVAYYLLRIASRLIWRAIIHDLSKYRWSEAKHFIPHIHVLKGLEYTKEEYRLNLEKIKPAIILHQKRNRHHPEYHANHIKDMRFLDELEMVCDWTAASRRHKSGNPYVSVYHNQHRFVYGDERLELYKKILEDLGVKNKRT